MRHVEVLQAACPRCGYDLSGETARWVEVCPVRGVCSECGTEFQWRHAIAACVATGFIENARGVRQVLRWSCYTWVKALVPWKFWSWRALETREQFPRLVLWVLVCVHLPKIMEQILFLPLFWGSLTVFGVWGHISAILSCVTEPFLQIMPAAVPPEMSYVHVSVGDWPTAFKWIGITGVALPIIPFLLARDGKGWLQQARRCLRATLYSFVIMSLISVTTFVLSSIEVFIAEGMVGWGSVWIFRLERFSAFILFVLAVFGFVWLWAWWYCVLSTGWKARRSKAVWCVSVLLTTCLCVLLAGVEFSIQDWF